MPLPRNADPGRNGEHGRSRRLTGQRVVSGAALPAEWKPYHYQGDGSTMTDEQVRQHLAGVRARLAGLDIAEAVEGPSPEWHREAAQEITDLAILPPKPAPAPAPSLATSREARAACPVPQIIKLRPYVEPVSVSGQRPFLTRPIPDSLAGRIAALSAAPPDGWCDGCGYKLARCCCPGGPRGGTS